MRKLCSWIANIFLILWLLAVAALLIGLFGPEPDPLAGAFLIPLGLPWTLAIDQAPQVAWPWLLAVAPGINLVLIRAICAKRSGKDPAA